MTASLSLEKLWGLLLGPDPKQRRYLQVTISATAAYTVSGLFQWHAVQAGLADREQATWLLTTILVTQVVFFLLVRLGVGRRIKDPALTLPQMATSIVLLAWAYHINPHTRGVTISVAALVVSYSALTSRPRQCLGIGLFAVLTFSAVMALGARLQPEVFNATIELHHFGFLTVVILTLAFLAGRHSAMRMKLHEQRNRLTEALEQLATIATRDVLTGLPNRRYIQDWLAQTTAQCQRQGIPLSVALMDIDHFKRVNDTLGHEAGDTVLKRFATMMRGGVREGDLLGRWGGEEFVWVMVGAEPGQARAAVDRMRTAVSRPEAWTDVPGWPVSFSAGLAQMDDHQDMATALRRADTALYAAKRAGRACTQEA